MSNVLSENSPLESIVLQVPHWENLDAIRISQRLKEFRDLEPGWLEGSGKKFDADSLFWLNGFLTMEVCPFIKSPRLYPIEGENVSAEWDVGRTAIILEFYLKERKAHFFSMHKDSRAIFSADFDLKTESGKLELVTLLRERILE